MWSVASYVAASACQPSVRLRRISPEQAHAGAGDVDRVAIDNRRSADQVGKSWLDRAEQGEQEESERRHQCRAAALCAVARFACWGNCQGDNATQTKNRAKSIRHGMKMAEGSPPTSPDKVFVYQ